MFFFRRKCVLLHLLNSLEELLENCRSFVYESRIMTVSFLCLDCIPKPIKYGAGYATVSQGATVNVTGFMNNSTGWVKVQGKESNHQSFTKLSGVSNSQKVMVVNADPGSTEITGYIPSNYIEKQQTNLSNLISPF